MVSELYIFKSTKARIKIMFGLPSGWLFSGMNYDMSSDSLSSSLNIQYNLGLAKADLFPGLWSYPALDSMSCVTYPNMLDNNNILLNPMLAVQQWNQQRQNGGGIFNFGGGSNGYGNFGFGDSFNNTGFFGQNGGINGSNNNGNIFGGVFGGNNAGVNNGGNTGLSNEQKELNKLKNVFESLKKQGLSEEVINKYNEALKNKTNAEKVSALKDLLKEVLEDESNAENVKNAIYSDKDIKEKLINLGYKFPDNDIFKAENDNDKTIKKDMKDLKSAIDSDNTNNLQSLAGKIQKNQEQILRYVSAWNKSNIKDNSCKSMIEVVAEKGASKSATEQEPYKGFVKIVSDALISKANKYDDSYAEIAKKVETLSKALEPFNKANAKVTKSQFNDAAKAFQELYALVRITEAQELDKEINEKFGFFNEYKEGIVGSGIITKSVKAELSQEKVDIPTNIDDADGKEDGKKTIEEQAKELGAEFKYTANGVKVYNNSKTGKWYVVDNDELKYVGDGKYVNKDGNICSKKTSETEQSVTDFLQNDKTDNKKQKDNTSKLTDAEKDAEQKAQDVYDKLWGHTSVTEGEEVQQIIEDLETDDIYRFMNKYIELDGSGSKNRNGGLCDQIDNEGDWSLLKTHFKKDVAADVILTLVTKVLKWAEENDLTDDLGYKRLKKYKEDDETGEILRKNAENTDYYIYRLIDKYKNIKD